jgi:hypothetical protein
MKAVEFKAKMRNRLIKVPKNISADLSGDKEVRVIVLLDEFEKSEDNSFKKLSKDQFLAGYSDSDAIYDSY